MPIYGKASANFSAGAGWGRVILRFALGASLILAGAIKMGNPLAFRKTLDAYGFFPEALTIPVAVILPPFELLCGCLLVLNLRVKTVSAAVAGMMLVFSAISAVSLWLGAPPDCGCFGTLTWLNWPPPVALARDLVLLGFAVALHRAEGKES